MLSFREVSGLPTGFALLRDASVAEGFDILARLEQRCREGAGFEGPGEGLFAASKGARLLGVAGLRVDPYLEDPNVGRVRQVYVAPEARRRSVARELVTRVIERATDSFTRLQLRTEEEPADHVYRALAFHPIEEPDATHVIETADLARRRTQGT